MRFPPSVSMLQSFIIAWVRLARRGWPVVLLGALAGSVAALDYVRTNLGMNTDTADMISPALEWRQRDIEFSRHFPQFSDTLAIVIDATTPDLAADAATRLSDALARQRDVFLDVHDPADHPFFRRHAMLFLHEAARERLVRDLAAAQPLLGRLHRDPGLAAVLGLLADAVQSDVEVAPDTLAGFSGRLAAALEAAVDGGFHRLSWRRALAPGRSAQSESDLRRVVVASPVLDYNQLFPAARSMAAVRAQASALGLDEAHGVSVRITGGLAMSDEELRSVSRGAGRATALALAGVALVLAFGLGSVRLVAASLLTLVAGLLWTAAFAAAAVGHLNMISIAFAVLYIGLGVDYAVHYALRYRELLNDGRAHADALEHAAGDVGVSIALCAVTTGAGFFAFLPTSFAGVSELGLIAGVGMFVSLAATLTLMPALLSAVRPRRGGPVGRLGVHLPLAGALDAAGRRWPRTVVGIAAAAAVACSAAASGVHFDDNPLNLRDAAGEAVSTYRDLVADGNRWSLDLLVDGEPGITALAPALERLPEVSGVTSLLDFVPKDQAAGLARVDELALLLGPDLDGTPGSASPAAQALPALERLDALLTSRATVPSGLEGLARAVRRLTDAVRAAPAPQARDALLTRAQENVTGTLRAELGRLGDILDAGPVSLDALPPELIRDWRARDGRWRMRIDASGDLNRPEVLERFVAAVRTVAPDAVGTPVVHLESARVVVGAFAQAFALALACIAIIAYLAFRRVVDVAVLLTPLLLAALASVASMALLQVPFNFANVIALPLLLGVGVDSGIHMLARARASGPDAALSGSSTARGVVTSALTTMVSFGNLAFSPHPGTASMGLLLTIGMVTMLMATLLVLPALVRLVPVHANPVSVS